MSLKRRIGVEEYEKENIGFVVCYWNGIDSISVFTVLQCK